MNADVESINAITAAAREAAKHAYVPYSRFRVGAAVRGQKGIYRGCNVENATYGATLCAERSALAAFRQAGEVTALELAVACIDVPAGTGISTVMPCGICRQWFVELAPDAKIHVCLPASVVTFSAADLLPNAFRLPAQYFDRQP